MHYRQANADDAAAVAALHADSWRRHYRGAYSDAFLDGDVFDDRLAVWRERLERPDRPSSTIMAEDDSGLVGFVHVIFDDDPTYGALIDNLHVRHGWKRGGVGSRLLAGGAEAVIGRGESAALYLWVLEQNTDAQAFYEARGGKRGERARASAPGGVPEHLNGSPTKLRYAWPDAHVLLAPGRA